MKKPRLTSPKPFQNKILDWFSKNQRDLPWRQTRDPYKILVSEVMLQQTQVSRVIPKYEAWLKAFPTIKVLADVKTSQVLGLWSGLGYNRRAIYLQKTAQTIVSNFDGKFPTAIAQLKTLPGLGEYTARAVACFAFNQQVAVVDTNIRKVIAIEFYDGVPPPLKELQKIADQLLPAGKAYQWNQALMDYSAAVLAKHKVPIVKQSTFKNSNRYHRGQVIKQLLANKKLGVDEIGSLIKPDFSPTDTDWLNKLIDGLKKDNLIVVVKGSLSLP